MPWNRNQLDWTSASSPHHILDSRLQKWWFSNVYRALNYINSSCFCGYLYCFFFFCWIPIHLLVKRTCKLACVHHMHAHTQMYALVQEESNLLYLSNHKSWRNFFIYLIGIDYFLENNFFPKSHSGSWKNFFEVVPNMLICMNKYLQFFY